MDRKLRPGSFLCWSDVEKCEKLSHPQKFFSVWEKNLSSTTLVFSMKAVWEAQCTWVELWQDIGCSKLSFLAEKKKNYSSLIYQTIDLSGICSIFFKAVLDKNLILWTCSFLAPKWFYDTLAEHIGSKSILIHWGNFLFRESSDDFCIGPLVISSITTPWSSWGF